MALPWVQCALSTPLLLKKNLMYSLLTCKYDLVSIKNNSFKLLYLKIVISRN